MGKRQHQRRVAVHPLGDGHLVCLPRHDGPVRAVAQRQFGRAGPRRHRVAGAGGQRRPQQIVVAELGLVQLVVDGRDRERRGGVPGREVHGRHPLAGGGDKIVGQFPGFQGAPLHLRQGDVHRQPARRRGRRHGQGEGGGGALLRHVAARGDRHARGVIVADGAGRRGDRRQGGLRGVAQRHREGLTRLGGGVLHRRHCDGFRAVPRRKGQGVAARREVRLHGRVAARHRGRPVHLHLAAADRIQRHREGDVVALVGARVRDGQGRLVVIDDGPGRRGHPPAGWSPRRCSASP